MLVSSSRSAQNFQTIWLQLRTQRSRVVAECIAAGFTLSFLCHYLGLRSSSWWFACGELTVCITAALARSLTKSRLMKFSSNPDQGVPRLDWRCCSTGVVSVTESKSEIDSASPMPCLDFRAYSDLEDLTPVSTAKRLAWALAGWLLEDLKLLKWLADLIGIQVFMCQNDGSSDDRALIVCLERGILVKEGLASPTNYVSVAFCSSFANISAPTGLPARGFMGQPSWKLDTHQFANMMGTIG
jgi:hypothetical protein